MLAKGCLFILSASLGLSLSYLLTTFVNNIFKQLLKTNLSHNFLFATLDISTKGEPATRKHEGTVWGTFWRIQIFSTNITSIAYLKNSLRYWDFKILRKWYFVVPWSTKIDVTRSIFEIQGSSFGFSPLLLTLKTMFSNLGSMSDS